MNEPVPAFPFLKPAGERRSAFDSQWPTETGSRDMRLAVKVGFAVVTAFAIAGCATQQIGHDFDETKLSSFKPHQTTLDEVVASLGQPMERETESDGSVRLHYQWIKSGSGVSSYVPVVSMFHTSVHTDAKDAFLYFGPDGRYIRAEQNEMHSS